MINVPDVGQIREKTGLSQARFAELLGVSVRTLQDWEQGRRAPSGAARTLLLIADRNPRTLLGCRVIAFESNLPQLSAVCSHHGVVAHAAALAGHWWIVMKIVDDRSVENMQVVGAGQWTQTLAFGSDPDGRVTNCRERSGIS